jgi:N-acyl homoserine lactone hydrolase
VLLAGCSAGSKSSQNAAAGPVLYVLDGGDITLADKSLMSPGVDQGKPINLVDTCYLIVHPRGMLLWDSGLPDALASMPDGINSGAFTMRRKATLSAQLAQLGYTPESINYVAFSHLHGDHAGNANMFARSTWLVQRVEHDAAFSAQAAQNGFDVSQYDSLRNAQKTLLTGDHDVFGDGSVMILSTPGHTVGHQSLMVRLRSDTVVLSGDLWHFRENRERRGVPSFNYNKEQTLASMERMEQILRDNNARLIIQHDPQDVGALVECLRST